VFLTENYRERKSLQNPRIRKYTTPSVSAARKKTSIKKGSTPQRFEGTVKNKARQRNMQENFNVRIHKRIKGYNKYVSE
jgi:iron uptake system EfeUOB component EfeO/EfeM